MAPTFLPTLKNLLWPDPPVADLVQEPVATVYSEEQLQALEALEVLTSAGLAPTTPSTLPAHKMGRQTSYSSTGLINDTPDLSELGSSQPTIIREVVPELTSPTQRRIVYNQMMNDSSCDVSIRTIKTPGLGADYFVEPFSDDPNDQMVAQFVADNLLYGLSAPFINSLEDIYSFFENGKTVLEKVVEMRPWAPNASGANSKTYTMISKLSIRPESTLGLTTYDDNGEVVSIAHNAIRGDNTVEEVPLPVEKLLIFTFGRKGGNIDGKSILRTAYPHWYYKTHLYKIDAIQKERHSLGVPKGKLLPGFNQKDVAILRTLLRNLRNNEESFMVLTPNVDVEFAEVHGNLVDVMTSIDHHNMMIMMNVMAQFLVIASSSGARSNAATQVDVFMKALRYIANYLADVINMHLIPELVVWNFPTTNFPKLKVKNMGEAKDLQMLASGLSNLLAQKAITPTLETENMIRTMFGLTKISQAEFDAYQAQQTAATTPNPAQNSNQNGNIKPGADKSGNVGKSPTNAN